MSSGHSTVILLAIAIALVLGGLWFTLAAPMPAEYRVAAMPEGALLSMELSPGYSVYVNPGDVVEYIHTLTNTGTLTASYSVVAVPSEPWPLLYTNATYPAGTALLMPFPLGAGQSITLGLILTVPSDAPGAVVNTTTLTVTSLSPVESAVAYDLAIIGSRAVYLPLVLRQRPLSNGYFTAGLTDWTVLGTLGVSVAVDPDSPLNPVALLGNPAYECRGGVPIASGSIRQSFYVARDPSGRQAHLRFRYRIYTNDLNTSLLDKWDTFDVLVNGAVVLRDANTVIKQDCPVDKHMFDLGWRYADITLGLGGTTTTLELLAANRTDKFYNTYVYVDDVRIEYVE